MCGLENLGVWREVVFAGAAIAAGSEVHVIHEILGIRVTPAAGTLGFGMVIGHDIVGVAS